jgi:hypothetical protein
MNKNNTSIQEDTKVKSLLNDNSVLTTYIYTLESLLDIRKDITLTDSLMNVNVIQQEIDMTKYMKNNNIHTLSKVCSHQMVKDTIDTWENGMMNICYCSKCLLSDEVIFENKYKEELNMNM